MATHLDDIVEKVENRLKEERVLFIFDTGGVTRIYKRIGEDIFTDWLANEERVITEECIRELENQRDSYRLDDDGTLLTPYQLLNRIYTVCGMEEVTRKSKKENEKYQQTYKQDRIIRAAMKRGSVKTGN